ncbi:hypothetical protein AVEN_266076-1 [Araneus ventricosus]|uniref:Uncharacterized protein n=1 Tax=Araneus ventricosus TaxID=182803 RepID=A0A4Y2PGU8_ARAVE|nr:hypothetical protein AVEN_266076-1 [Araneus ventricosus]
MQRYRTFCGSATHQMAPPIDYWSTDALICACTKKFQFDKKRKERRSFETAIWDTSPKEDNAAAEIYYGFMVCSTDLHAVFKTEKVVAESLEAARWQGQS